MCCRQDNVSEVANSNVLSYDAFIEQQKAAKKKEPKTKTYDNLPPYEVVVDVSRTDRVQIEKDGVFVRNIFVPLSDVATLEQLLLEIEANALDKENSEEIEFDEWDNSKSVKGDTKIGDNKSCCCFPKKQGLHIDDKPLHLPHSTTSNIKESSMQSPADSLSMDSEPSEEVKPWG